MQPWQLGKDCSKFNKNKTTHLCKGKNKQTNKLNQKWTVKEQDKVPVGLRNVTSKHPAVCSPADGNQRPRSVGTPVSYISTQSQIWGWTHRRRWWLWNHSGTVPALSLLAAPPASKDHRSPFLHLPVSRNVTPQRPFICQPNGPTKHVFYAPKNAYYCTLVF